MAGESLNALPRLSLAHLPHPHLVEAKEAQDEAGDGDYGAVTGNNQGQAAGAGKQGQGCEGDMSDLVKRLREPGSQAKWGPRIADEAADRIEALEDCLKQAVPLLEKTAEFLSRGPIMSDADRFVEHARALLGDGE